MKTRRIMLLLAIALAIITVPLAVPPAAAQAVDAPWPMFRQNTAHTGEGQGTAPTYMVLNWKFETGGPVHSSPSIVGGKVYVGSSDMYWYCINALNGSLNWKFKTSYPITSSAAIVDGKLYTGADDGNVYCLNANNGTRIWTSPGIGSPRNRVSSSAPTELGSSPCVVGGRVYIGATDNRVYCLDTNTGAKIWNYTTGGRVDSSPAIVNNRVYVGSLDNYFYCLNANNGSLVWKWSTVRPGETESRGLGVAGGVTGSASVADGKVFFFGVAGGRYWCLDANTGNPIWLFWPKRQRYNYQNPRPLDIKVGGVHPGDQPGHDPIAARTVSSGQVTPAYHDGNVYLVEDTFIQRLNAATGERYWEPYPGMTNRSYTDYIGNATLYGQDPLQRKMNSELFLGFITYCSPLFADGKVYEGSRLNALYCNDAITGKRYSWYETGDWTISSPAVAYGNVYTGSFDWNLYCFKEGGISAYRKPGSYRTATSISAALSSTTVVVGTRLNITGTVTPSLPADPYKGAPSVIAYFDGPGLTRWEETWHVKSNQYGWYMGDSTYEISFIPKVVGTWTVKVQLHAMQFDPYLPSETTTMTFTVVAASSSPTTLQTTSALSIITILAAPAVVAIPVAVVLHRRKK